MQRERSKATANAPAVSSDGRRIRSLNGWTEEPPTGGGEYWHWNGCQSCAPLPMFVEWSGGIEKSFVRMGQLGIKEAIDCDQYGGWWMKINTPAIPDIDHCHCESCDS